MEQLSLVRLAKEIPRKPGPFRTFQDRQTGVSLQLRLNGGGSRIRTSDTLLGYALSSHVLAAYRNLRPEAKGSSLG
jgi:hypothetical protein